MRTLVWFRGKDLRISDHAPLHAALQGDEVITLFVVDPYFFAPERAAELPHRMQFLAESLASLAKNIKHLGGRLLCVPGRSVDVVPALAKQWRVDRVVAHRWVEPFGRERDRRIGATLDCPFELFEGEMLHPPGTLRTQSSNTPFAVYSPFSRAFRKTVIVDDPLPAPKALPPPPADVRADTVPVPDCAALGLTRNPALQPGGERAAQDRLNAWLDGAADRYAADRNRMDLPHTSRLSADLKFGTLSVRTVWTRVLSTLGEGKATTTYLNELLWREFSHSTLWDRPELLQEPFRPKFKDFPWGYDAEHWQAWADGKTGYPVVDAAARQLLAEGFVHNRARMISASFLTKHLLIHYKYGEAHYLKYLTDGDWAQNNAGWQWSAGCGCDAQPYFRVFNPMSQGEKFDPTGGYVRRWVPELSRLPTRYLHAPWTAPAAVLSEAGVVLGETYPKPIVDHQEARATFLDMAKGYLKGPAAS